MSPLQRDVIEAARSWIGTPYHHQASKKGVGCDCLGLIRGVYEELYGRPAERPPAYSQDWGEAQRRETLIEGAERHLIRSHTDSAPLSTHYQPADVVIFRLRQGAIAKHAAIVSERGYMIHAVEGAPVCEVSLGPWWQRHIAAIFSFPEVKAWRL